MVPGLSCLPKRLIFPYTHEMSLLQIGTEINMEITTSISAKKSGYGDEIRLPFFNLWLLMNRFYIFTTHPKGSGAAPRFSRSNSLNILFATILLSAEGRV